MKVADKTAKTVEEAIELGLAELGVSRDQVTVQVLEEPGKKESLDFLAVKWLESESILRMIREHWPVNFSKG